MARLGHIDALRGLAALSVVIQHSAELVGLGFGAFNGGRFGVQLFFLLSGFLICSILLRSLQKNGTQDLRRFYLRRVLRTFPSYYVVLTILAPPGGGVTRSLWMNISALRWAITPMPPQ